MKTFIVLIVVILLAVGGYFLYKNSYKTSNQSTSDSTSVSTNSVSIKNMSFNPANITVKAGSTITFTNNDGINHTVTADNGKFNQSVSAGQSTTFTIAEPGTYTYHCSIHPSMTGTIIVQ